MPSNVVIVNLKENCFLKRNVGNEIKLKITLNGEKP